jgi:putative Holliday junction resolvase
LPVRLFDERFTTADAMSRMAGVGFTNKKKKKRVDAIAAQVILESFLEACRYRNDIAGEPVDSNPAGGECL